MKTKTILLMLFYVFIIEFCNAQTLVSTSPQGRNAVLEELTGVDCPNCPDGHKRADSLFLHYPGRVVIMNMHGTEYSGAPNFLSPWVDPIDDFIGVAGYPAGSMNRIVWSGEYNTPPYFPQNPPGNLAIRRNGWWDDAYIGQTAGEWIILNGGNSFVNIGASSVYDSFTQVITITVELYYTSSSPVDTNKINVAILQNNVVGYQYGAGLETNNYNHKNIFRDFITGQWGEVITPTTIGTFITKTYEYTLPATYNDIASDINNMDIVVFVTQADNKSTETGIKIKALDGTTVSNSEFLLNDKNLSIYPNPANNEINIESPQAKINSNSILSIYNVQDQLLFQQTLKQERTMIDISDFAKGVYILRLSNNENTVVKRFVKE